MILLCVLCIKVLISYTTVHKETIPCSILTDVTRLLTFNSILFPFTRYNLRETFIINLWLV